MRGSAQSRLPVCKRQVVVVSAWPLVLPVLALHRNAAVFDASIRCCLVGIACLVSNTLRLLHTQQTHMLAGSRLLPPMLCSLEWRGFWVRHRAGAGMEAGTPQRAAGKRRLQVHRRVSNSTSAACPTPLSAPSGCASPSHSACLLPSSCCCFGREHAELRHAGRLFVLRGWSERPSPGGIRISGRRRRRQRPWEVQQ